MAICATRLTEMGIEMLLVLRDDNGKEITNWWWPGDSAITVQPDDEKWIAVAAR
jgi:hypothetical protein